MIASPTKYWYAYALLLGLVLVVLGLSTASDMPRSYVLGCLMGGALGVLLGTWGILRVARSAVKSDPESGVTAKAEDGPHTLTARSDEGETTTATRVRSARWNVITRMDWWLAFATAFLAWVVYLLASPTPQASTGLTPAGAIGIQGSTAQGVAVVGFFGYFLVLRWLLLLGRPGWFSSEYCSRCEGALKATDSSCPGCKSALTSPD